VSFGLQNINNTNKLSRVTSCLKFTYLMYLFWQFFFSWLNSPSRPQPLHFQGLITFKNGLRKAIYTLVASEFTSCFQTRWRLNLSNSSWSLFNFTCYSLASIISCL
jgi:hypothetical protein